jgi:hypothetical protein
MTTTDTADPSQMRKLAQFYWPLGLADLTDREVRREPASIVRFWRTAGALRATADALEQNPASGRTAVDTAHLLELADSYWPRNTPPLTADQARNGSVAVARDSETAALLRSAASALTPAANHLSTEPFRPDYRPLLFREGDIVEYVGTSPSKVEKFAGYPAHVISGGWFTVYVSAAAYRRMLPVPGRHLRLVEPAAKPPQPAAPIPPGTLVEYAGTAPSILRVFAGDAGVVINRRTKPGWAYVRPPHGLYTLPIKTRHLRLVEGPTR